MAASRSSFALPLEDIAFDRFVDIIILLAARMPGTWLPGLYTIG
jgi:hypothetical protein